MLLWILAGLSIAGTILNVKRRRSGFVLWLLTNVIWAVIDLRAGLGAQAVLFMVYAGLALWGFATWSRQGLSTPSGN